MTSRPDRRALALAALATVLLFGPLPPATSASVDPPPVLLTFDDGPDPVWTVRALDVLRWKGARAIFCVTGAHAQMFPALVRRVATEGHTLCVHSWSHRHLTTLPPAEQRAEVDRTLTLLVSLVGSGPVRFWRAPYGQSTSALDAYAESRGLIPLGWNAQGSDWAASITPAVVEGLVESPVNGLGAVPLTQHATTSRTPPGIAVVLLHDGRGESTTAVPADRWPGMAVLVSLLDRYRIVEPASVSD